MRVVAGLRVECRVFYPTEGSVAQSCSRDLKKGCGTIGVCACRIGEMV